jgi:Holliday junction resolvasome RuvABC DNA-binding subunit
LILEKLFNGGIVMETNQALGYATLALKNLGYNKAEIEKITNQMLNEFDNYREDEVEDIADEILYDDEKQNE